MKGNTVRRNTVKRNAGRRNIVRRNTVEKYCSGEILFRKWIKEREETAVRANLEISRGPILRS